MKRHAYGGTNLVMIAVPETSCLVLLLNLKKLFFNTNSVILNKSYVGINFCLAYLSSLVATHYRPRKTELMSPWSHPVVILNTPGLEIQHLNLEIQYFKGS